MSLPATPLRGPASPLPNPRHDFLRALFRRLAETGVGYCVLRNYQTLYEDTQSDIDLLVEPGNAAQTREGVAAAGRESGLTLVLKTRYVNDSFVFQSAQGTFLRLDVEYEIRWRFLPVLTARAILTSRQKFQDFYVPHPRHESIIVFVAALWRGYLSERYQGQLQQLYQRIDNQEQLTRSFQSAFGKAGRALAESQGLLPKALPAGVWRDTRKSLLRHCFRSQAKFNEMFGYLWSDAWRLVYRLRRPPGVSLLYACQSLPSLPPEELFGDVRFLFPKEKLFTIPLDLGNSSSGVAGVNLRLRFRRAYVLFKGGLFMRLYGVPPGFDVQQVLGSHTRFIYPRRTFVGVALSGKMVMAHVGTGFMSEMSSSGSKSFPSPRVMDFIANILARTTRNEGRKQSKKRGKLLVIRGGSEEDRTTLARRLGCLAYRDERYNRVVYLQPSGGFFPGLSLPWPPFSATSPAVIRPLNAALKLLNRTIHWLLLRLFLRSNCLIIAKRGDNPPSRWQRLFGWALKPLLPKPDVTVLFSSREDPGSPETFIFRNSATADEQVKALWRALQ